MNKDRVAKYKVGDLVKHKLGFPVVITCVYDYGYVDNDGPEIEVEIGPFWNRRKEKQKTELSHRSFSGTYDGRIFVGNNSPTEEIFKEEELQ